MSREFVRTIKNTKIKGDIKEPLGTNLQNDLLSDDEDVAIRNQDGYHILTDNIKVITSANELLTVNKTGKNSVELDVKPSEDIDLTRYATKEELNEHVDSKSNPHGVTKSQVGLGSVDNFQHIRLGAFINSTYNDTSKSLLINNRGIVNVQMNSNDLINLNKMTFNKLNFSQGDGKAYIIFDESVIGKELELTANFLRDFIVVGDIPNVIPEKLILRITKIDNTHKILETFYKEV